MNRGRPWVTAREQAYKQLCSRAKIAVGSYGGKTMARECRRLFGVRPPFMTTRQMHLCIAWLTALNCLTWTAKRLAREPSTGV